MQGEMAQPEAVTLPAGGPQNPKLNPCLSQMRSVTGKVRPPLVTARLAVARAREAGGPREGHRELSG